MLYAIGEILLVVIGILLALQINNWNENRKQKNQLNGILQDVASDLKKDTLLVGQAIKFYQLIDSASIRIMNKEITKDNYRDCRICPSLATLYRPVVINKKGFELLKLYSNENFTKNDSLVSNIVQGYNSFIALFDANNQRLETNVVKNVADFEKYSWYVDLMGGKITDDFINYMIMSEDFRKKVATQKVYAVGNMLAHAKVYMQFAETTLEKIDQRLKGKNLQVKETTKVDSMN